MSQQTVQLIEIAILAIGFMFGIVSLARRRLISFRYTVGWLALGSVALMAGLLIPLLGPIARVFRVGELTMIAVVAVVVLLVVCVQLSISISGLQSQVQRLSEVVAILQVREEESDDR